MRLERATDGDKGWLAGPWDSGLGVSVGFATEAHTFFGSSADYLHFVVHSPGLTGDEARREKQLVSRSRLGL